MFGAECLGNVPRCAESNGELVFYCSATRGNKNWFILAREASQRDQNLKISQISVVGCFVGKR